MSLTVAFASCFLCLVVDRRFAASSPILELGSTRIDLGPVSLGIPSDPVNALTNSTKCLGPLGCFSNDRPFYDPIRRPISLLPFDRELLDVRFLLYTRRNPDSAQILSKTRQRSLVRSNFNPEMETKIIVHGFLDNIAFANWIPEMKDLLLLRDNYNVIVVDWGRANKFPYSQAVANCRAVGAEIALLIKRLQTLKNAKPEKMHIIGHSLGAQIAGYAGERTPHLGRITGLDPAGPLFTGTDPSVRLDPTDANFVDVIHSDASPTLITGLGTISTIGHVDFFPNNGDNQPGCDPPVLNILGSLEKMLSEGIHEGLRQSIVCDHQRAEALFTASIMPNKCMPVALSCLDWDNFVQGKCGDCEDDGNRCAVLGLDTPNYYKRNPKHRRFYLRTSAEKPFCLFQYQVTLVMGDEEEARKVKGKAGLMVHGRSANLRAKLSSGSESFKPGSYQTYLIASKNDIGDIESVDFKWKTTTNSGILSPIDDILGLLSPPRESRLEDNSELYVRLVRITPLAMPSRQGRKLISRTFCQKVIKPIRSGESVRLSASNNC